MDRLALKCSAAAVLFALCIAPAQAAPKLFTPGDVVYYSATGGPGRTPITVHHPQSVWPPQVTGSGASTGVKLQGAARVTLPGAQLAVQYERQAAAKVLAKGAATLMLRSIPSVALTVLAVEGLRYALEGWERQDGTGGVVIDQPGTNGANVCSVIGEVGGYASGVYSGSGFTNEPGIFTIVVNPAAPDGVPWPAGWYFANNCTSLPRSGAYFPQALFLPNGSLPSGDWVPAGRGDIEDAVEEHLRNHPEDIPTVVKEISDNGLDWDELGASPIVTSGPASVPGPVTTSTRQSDAGTTTEEAEITYHITYEGNEVGITKTTTTTITYPDSSTETISETVDFPQTGGGEPVEPPTDFCEEHPNASACEPLGDNDGEDPELPEDERSVVFDKKMSATGSCPSPITFTIHGQSYSLEYTPLCTLASGVRPVVLGLGWLSAGIFLFGTLRNS